MREYLEIWKTVDITWYMFELEKRYRKISKFIVSWSTSRKYQTNEKKINKEEIFKFK